MSIRFNPFLGHLLGRWFLGLIHAGLISHIKGLRPDLSVHEALPSTFTRTVYTP